MFDGHIRLKVENIYICPLFDQMKHRKLPSFYMSERKGKKDRNLFEKNKKELSYHLHLI